MSALNSSLVSAATTDGARLLSEVSVLEFWKKPSGLVI